MEFQFEDVNEAFPVLVEAVNKKMVATVEEDSRNGKVIRVKEPVTVRYTKPSQMVLFNPFRDCNPFFHLYEALWMMMGRKDVGSLAYFNKKMTDFSDDGETLNGAYGHRWGEHPIVVEDQVLLVNQLAVIVDHLKKNRQSRRAVLSMWDVAQDLLKVNTSKDVCCNTHVYFSIDCERREHNSLQPCMHCCLHMTVINRSNDMIWGMLGANYVHFSFLLQLMASAIGVQVGQYTHFTNNLHVYQWNWKPDYWLQEEKGRTAFSEVRNYRQIQNRRGLCPLVQNFGTFGEEVERVSTAFFEEELENFQLIHYKEPFIQGVVKPMLVAFALYKRGEKTKAWNKCREIKSEDWRTVASEWVERRHGQTK